MPPSSTDQGVQDRAVLARLEVIESIARTGSGDAREARDGMLKLTAIIGEQRYGERIEALHGNLEKCIEKVEVRIGLVESAVRQDFVHAIKVQDQKRDALGTKVDDHDRRLDSLEATRTQSESRTGVVHWIVDHAWPVVVAVAAGVVGALGFKGAHH